jgi:LytS/YehU family sensor histidine kinase
MSFLRGIENRPRAKRLRIELPCYFAVSVFGFFVCMTIFSKVYKFEFFTRQFLLNQLSLLFVIYVIMSGLVYAFKFYRELKDKEATEETLRRLAAEIELRGLKSQMNPHFLFNALNSISALVTEDPKQAREMIARLSELLRISLERRDRMLVPLQEELDFARLYLGVEHLRFRDRMDVREKVDPELLGVLFPAMVLQPLLENAVKHGIAKKRGKGIIRLEMKRKDKRIKCLISNTVSEAMIRNSDTVSNGTGLKNIRQRLDLLYKDEYDLSMGYSGKESFDVHLSLPVKDNG